jgi:pyruvate/2-oxoglutarate dehydrogenase complex dihydrolipoamide dehydrogenase (E3) component
MGLAGSVAVDENTRVCSSRNRAAASSFPYLTNSGILELDSLPEHLVIVGGSYIGLEFGQMYRRFGSRVTIVERGPRVIPREDEDISAAVREILEGEGVEIRTGAECVRVERRGEGVAIGLDCEGGASDVEGTHLLVATGRTPNTHDLGVESAGIELDERGFIRVDEELRTSAEGVWALGECNGRGAFTHTSYNDYEIVAGNLLDGETRRVGDRIPTYGLFVDPPLGRAGMTEAEVRASGRRALIATRPMSRVARAKERGETLGLMKVVVDAETQRILGAAVLGIGGDEIIHSILDVMYADAPYTVIQRAVHIHPTVSELIPTMLADLTPLG